MVLRPFETQGHKIVAHNFEFEFEFFNIFEAKRGVDFHHSTRNASRIWQNVMENGVLATLGFLCLPYRVRDTGDDKIYI